MPEHQGLGIIPGPDKSSQFPSVQLDRINVLGNESTNTVTVVIKYSIPQQGVSDNIEINFG